MRVRFAHFGRIPPSEDSCYILVVFVLLTAYSLQLRKVSNDYICLCLSQTNTTNLTDQARKTEMEPLRHFNIRLLERVGPGFIHYPKTSHTLPIGNQTEK